jgi:hypothetical protein
MDAGTYNPVISSRGSWRKRITLNADPAIDFTGCEARAEIRDAREGTTLYASISETPSADGYILIPDGAPNKIQVFFSATATARLLGPLRRVPQPRGRPEGAAGQGDHQPLGDRAQP